MNCPACNEPLVVLEYESVEVDYCVACEGVWLDAGELELLFGDADACGAFMKAGGAVGASAHGEKPRRCPICRKRMDKALTGGEHPVTYDRCVHGLWFDKGELGEILKHGHASTGNKHVADFLGSVFAARESETPSGSR